MSKKLFAFMFMFLFAISLASASYYAFDLGFITQKQGDCFNIFEPCDNCTYMNITILYPNGTAIVENEAMTNLSSTYYYNYTFCDTNTSGIYPLIITYDDGAYSYSETDFFEITPTGLENPTGLFLAFFILLFLVISVGTILITLRYFERGVNLEMDLRDLIFSFISFFVFLMFYYFAFFYWGNPFVMDLLETFLWVVGFMNLFVASIMVIFNLIKRVGDTG